MAESVSVSDSTATVFKNGVKLVGEAVLPGASLLMDGRFVEGAAHAVVGIGARLALGPFGALVVAADSFSKSVTDQNLWEYLPRVGRTDGAQVPARGPAPARAVRKRKNETKAAK
jgi:hypothetical protein